MRRTPPVPDHTIRSATFHIPLWLPSFGSRSYLAAAEKRPADRSKLIIYAAAWFVGPTFPSQFGSWWASVHKESHPFRWDIRNQTNSSSVGITQYHPGLGCVVLTVSLAISHCLLNFTWYPLEQTFFLTNQEPIFMAGSRPAGLWSSMGDHSPGTGGVSMEVLKYTNPWPLFSGNFDPGRWKRGQGIYIP